MNIRHCSLKNSYEFILGGNKIVFVHWFAFILFYKMIFCSARFQSWWLPLWRIQHPTHITFNLNKLQKLSPNYSSNLWKCLFMQWTPNTQRFNAIHWKTVCIKKKHHLYDMRWFMKKCMTLVFSINKNAHCTHDTWILWLLSFKFYRLCAKHFVDTCRICGCWEYGKLAIVHIFAWQITINSECSQCVYRFYCIFFLYLANVCLQRVT